MEENGTPTRPVRTLTVKNFSVIKEAKLEFGKITVLIGPQASGKSLLCKLAYFLQQVVVEQAQESMRVKESFERFRERANSEFVRWFGVGATSFGKSEIHYADGRYQVWVTQDLNSPITAFLQCEFSDEIKGTYENLSRRLEIEALRLESIPNPKFFADEMRDRLSLLRGRPDSPDSCVYIPSTRSFFLTIQRAVMGTAGRMDDISLRFSQSFDYGFEATIPKEGQEHTLRQWFDSESEHILQGKVVPLGNDFLFQTTDGRKLSFSILSSGTQELLPLITLLREYVARFSALAVMLESDHTEHTRLFFIEEPEANVFPTTQYDLVRLLTRLCNEPLLSTSWLITTHSPYILTAFNGLIEAWRAGNKPGKRGEVAALIPEQYWIDENDFAAYTIRDGVLVSIFEREAEGKEGSGLIDGDYLDSISDELGSQFEKLLDIEYAD